MAKQWPIDWLCSEVECTLVDSELLVLAYFRDGANAHYVVLCRSLIPGEDQRVYLERDDQIWAAYDSFTSCQLSHDRIEFILTDNGRSKLAVDSKAFNFAIDVSKDTLWELRRTLAVIFAGRTDYIDKTSAVN